MAARPSQCEPDPTLLQIIVVVVVIAQPVSIVPKEEAFIITMHVSFLGIDSPGLGLAFRDRSRLPERAGGVEAAGSVRSFGILAAMGLGEEERFDLVDEDCRLVGSTKPRSEVHRDGDWHQAVHVWVLFYDTWRVVMQRRCKHKDSWPLMWDISAAGHVTAGGKPLETAKRELAEELGLEFPDNAFRYLFRNKQEFRG